MNKLFLISLVALFASAINAAPSLINIGTTADYPPLTYKSESGFAGDDIQIINDFAKENNLIINFVQTSWPDLSGDLGQGKFVMAVGGISYNLERSRLFNLSDAIESSTKAPLIRCTDAKKFTSLAAIDNESIIVIENRGGTNQNFALKTIKHATLILVPQNASALAALTTLPPKADVMFTDDIEIAYRHKINPLLCLAAISERYPSTKKVFLFAKTAQGKDLQLRFNRWWLVNKNRYGSIICLSYTKY